MGGAGCCDSKPFGAPCAECAFGTSGTRPADFERGCAFCGAECRTDPLSAALQWAVRMHAGDGSGFSGAAEMLHTVATSPDVRRSGFEPSDIDMQLMLEIRGVLTTQQRLQQMGTCSGGHFAEKPRALVIGETDESLGTLGGPGEGPHMRSGKKDPKDPTIEVRTPSSLGGHLFGEIGYTMPLFNCGLPVGSWMYQEVEIHEHGIMMNKDGTRDGTTRKSNIIHELFKVGLGGCTIKDTHSKGLKFRDRNRPREKAGCLLCDYAIAREVRQYREASVTAPPGRLERGVEAPPEIPPESQSMFGVEDFHIIHFRQTGTQCLMKRKAVNWTNPYVKVGKRTFYNKWEMAFVWRIPCPPGRREPSDPAPSPREPQDPTPPEPPLSPRVFTSPGFALDGREVPTGASGWRSTADDDPPPARPGFEPVPVRKSPPVKK